jgi:hypothetical protein
MLGRECRPMLVEGGAAGEGERECTMFITTLEQLAMQENENLPLEKRVSHFWVRQSLYLRYYGIKSKDLRLYAVAQVTSTVMCDKKRCGGRWKS